MDKTVICCVCLKERVKEKFVNVGRKELPSFEEAKKNCVSSTYCPNCEKKVRKELKEYRENRKKNA